MVHSGITQRVWRLRSKRISLRLVLLCLLSLLLIAGWRAIVWEVMPLHAIAFSADGSRLAALGGLPDTSSGPAMRFESAVWDLQSGEKLLAIPLPPLTYSTAYSPDGKTLAFEMHSGEIQLWDASSGRRLRSWAADSAGIGWMAFTKRGEMLVSCKGEGPPKLWEVDSGRLLAVAPHAESGSYFSLQGDSLAVTHWEPLPAARKTRLYDLSERRFKELNTLPPVMRGQALSADGRMIAVADDRNLHVIEATTGRTIWRLGASSGMGSMTIDLAFSPVENTLAVLHATRDGPDCIKIWEPLTGKCAKTLIAHTSRDSSFGREMIRFSQDGRRLAVSNRAGEVRIWDLASGEQILVLPNLGTIRWQAPVLTGLWFAWCLAWVISGRRSTRRYTALIDAVVINALAFGLLLARLYETGYPYDNRRPAIWLLLSLQASWLCLAVFWTVFGKTRWPLRLAVLVVAASCAWCSLRIIIIEPTPGWNTWLMAVGMEFFMAFLLIAFGLGRWARIRLRSEASDLPSAAATQISLKDMLLWTTVLAGMLAVARLGRSFPLSVEQLASRAAYAACLALVAAAAAWSALGSARAIPSLISLVGLTLMSGFIASLIFRGPGDVPRHWQLGAYLMLAAVVWTSLSVFRLHGYRLERMNVRACTAPDAQRALGQGHANAADGVASLS